MVIFAKIMRTLHKKSHCIILRAIQVTFAEHLVEENI